jgi:hypothetical protein
MLYLIIIFICLTAISIVTFQQVDELHKTENGAAKIASEPNALDTLANIITVSAADYHQKPDKNVIVALSIIKSLFSPLNNLSSEQTEQVFESNILRNLTSFIKDFSVYSADMKTLVLSALASLHFAIKLAIESPGRMLQGFIPLVPGLIDYKYDQAEVQTLALECLTEIYNQTGKVPFQTVEICEKAKDANIYQHIVKCLKYQGTSVSTMTRTCVQCLSAIVYPVEDEIIPFPGLVNDGVNNISDELNDCPQDITVRAEVSKALTGKVNIIANLVSTKDEKLRIAALRVSTIESNC